MIASVDLSIVAEKITETHILPDILGNAKAFFVQKFKCRRCGASYRRIPLSGKCQACGGDVSQTVFRGAIEKYMELAENVLSTRIRDPYLKEHMNLALENVYQIFGREGEVGGRKGQTSLEKFI